MGRLQSRFPLPLHLSLAQNSPSMSTGQQGMGVPKVWTLERWSHASCYVIELSCSCDYEFVLVTWKVSNVYNSFMLISSYCMPLNKVLLELPVK
ncbi:hypothetical protein Nmel_005356, partial [Mimus melanotis]